MNISDVLESGLCTGCGACAYIAPQKVSMSLDNEGYMRPVVSSGLDVSEQQKFEQVCPGIVVGHKPRHIDSHHPIWGPIKDVKTGYSASEELRFVGSSGGVLTALASDLIENKIVDAIISTCASSRDPLGNETAVYVDSSALLKTAGSRYCPSAPVAALRDALQRFDRIAFIGKPCDVSAMRRLMDVSPEVKAKVPVLLSFMCAGIPSRRGTIEILEKFQMKEQDVIHFRYRGNGWPGKTIAQDINGRTESCDYNTSWGTILNRHLQPRCKICVDGIGEFADVVGADAWYGKDGYPDFAERDGRSLIVMRTDVGVDITKSAVDREKLFVNPFDIEDLAQIQPYQLSRKATLFARILALKLLFRKTPSYVNMQLLKALSYVGPMEILKTFVGTLKRALAGRL